MSKLSLGIRQWLAEIGVNKKETMVSSPFYMGPAGVEPATNAFRFVLVSQLPGLSLHHDLCFRWWSSSLYTFNAKFRVAWLGITSRGFPEFDHILSADFSTVAPY